MNRAKAGGMAVGAMLLLVGVSAETAGAQLRIIAPTADQHSTAAVRILVRAPAGHDSLQAELNLRDITQRFSRSGSNWRATLGRRVLDLGANHVSVRSWGEGQARHADAVTFHFGRRDRSMLDARVPTLAASTVPVRIAMRRQPDLLLRASLNGRPVGDVFDPGFALRRKARLSASHGLRYGANRLRIKAADRQGGFDVETRRFDVSRRQPLAAAGEDVLSRGQVGVRLDGRGSSATRPGRELDYAWKILSAPDGSTAELAHSQRVRPSLKPDEVGEYRVRLTVTEGGRRAGGPARSSTDVLSVTNAVNAAPIGVPLETLAFQEDAPGIQYGEGFFPVGDQPVQALVIDRASGEALFAGPYDGTAASAAELLALIEEVRAEKPLVVLSVYLAESAVQIDPSYNQVVSAITGQTLPASEFTDGAAFSVIGIPGTPSAAWVNPGWDPPDLPPAPFPGDFDGFLQLDSQDNLSLVPGSRIPADSSAPGAPAGQNRIMFGEQSFDSGGLASGCTDPGGFQVQFMSAEFLRPLSGDTFTTNGCGQAEDEQAQAQMAQFLNSDPWSDDSGGAFLVAIQSIQDPRGQDDGNWDELAAAVGNVGGDPSVFADSTKSYALIGAADGEGNPLGRFERVESAEVHTGRAAHATAVLAQSREGFLAPRESSATMPEFNFDLSVLAYQPSSLPPFPDSTSQEERDALRYIAEDLLELDEPSAGTSCYVPAMPDVRSEYCNDKYDTEWSGGFFTQLSETQWPTPAGHGFDEATWNTIKGHLVGGGGGYSEFNAVDQVWSVIGTLQGTYGADGQTAAALAQNAVGDVKGSIVGLEADDGAEGAWVDFIANFLNAVTYVLPEDWAAAPVVGMISGGLYLAEDGLAYPDGSPVLGRFEVDAKAFESMLQSNVSAANGALGRVLELIVTDSAKLQEFAQGTQYGANETQLASIAPAVTLGASKLTFETLIPAAYELVELKRQGRNADVIDAGEYECEGIFNGQFLEWYKPFAGIADSSQWLTFDGELYVVVLDDSPLPADDNASVATEPAPASLMDPLFEPYAVNAENVPVAFDFFKDSFYAESFDPAKTKTVACG